MQPWSPEPYIQLALVEELRGDLDQALCERLRQAQERDSEDWRLALIEARLQAGTRRRAAARAAFERAGRAQQPAGDDRRGAEPKSDEREGGGQRAGRQARGGASTDPARARSTRSRSVGRWPRPPRASPGTPRWWRDARRRRLLALADCCAVAVALVVRRAAGAGDLAAGAAARLAAGGEARGPLRRRPPRDAPPDRGRGAGDRRLRPDRHGRHRPARRADAGGHAWTRGELAIAAGGRDRPRLRCCASALGPHGGRAPRASRC